jgi:hypothetical protein
VFFFFSNRRGYFGLLMFSGAIRLALLFRLGMFFGRAAARTLNSFAGVASQRRRVTNAKKETEQPRA